jgi:hypothetical protein
MFRCTSLVAAACGLAVVLSGTASADGLTDSLKKGTPELKSAARLAFGPDGILFIGDNTSATVFAIGTGDVKGYATSSIKVDKLNEKIGAMLGVAASGIKINDLKVNPASGNLYLAIARGNLPAIVKLDRDGKLSLVELKDVPFSSAKLGNAGGGKSAALAITRMAYAKGKLYVAGLSNEEFASNLRVLAFPFGTVDKGSSTEIFHGAHGKLETNSPIRTFAIIQIANETTMLASYTCTPLVRIPVDSLKPGEKVKGITVAELGNGNEPLDMLPYSKGGKEYVLMANSKHGLIKVNLEGIDMVKPIVKQTGKAGLSYVPIPELTNVWRIDRLDNDRFVYLTKDGTLDTVLLP